MHFITRSIENSAFDECSKLKYLYISDKSAYFPYNNLNLFEDIKKDLEKIYVLNNKTLVIDNLVLLGIPRDKIDSWTLPRYDITLLSLYQLKIEIIGIFIFPVRESISLRF